MAAVLVVGVIKVQESDELATLRLAGPHDRSVLDFPSHYPVISAIELR